MAVIPGILASSKTGHLVTSNFFLISQATATSQTSISFTSIPQTYSHLQIRYTIDSNRSSYTDDNFGLQINGYSSNDQYMWHAIETNAGYVNAVAGSSGYNTDRIVFSPIPGTRSFSNLFCSSGIIDIHDYTSTTKYKTVKQISGIETNSSNGESVWIGSGFMNVNTNAITSLTLISGYGDVLLGTISLYGVK